MDIISFNEASTANGRIEKVIANPDSNSGIVTVPKVIEAGESVTIPAGRVAVLPNVQVDGVLDVQGEVFIPAGSGYSGTEVDATVVKQDGNVVANDIDVVHKNGDETIAGIKTFSDGLKLQGQSVSPFSGFKNYIINGNFDVWQRGTSQTTADYGSDDRWKNSYLGSSRTHSQVACTDTERVLFNANYFSRTVVTSVVGASSYALKNQRIEDVTRLAGKTVALSFWAKADSNKNIAVEFVQNFGTGGTPSSYVDGIGSQLVALTSTWQKKTITVTLPSIVGKTLGTDGVHTAWVGVYFWFDVGSNYSSRTANLGQQSGTFDIAQVQIEEGSVATPFENRPYGLELSLCQRYYYAENYIPYNVGFVFNSTSLAVNVIKLPVAMRVVPTITPINPSHITTQGNWGIYGATNGWISTGYTPNFSSSTNQYIAPQFDGVSGVTNGASYLCNGWFSALAEL